jgi:cyclic pyranopterin phosphate synthase
MIPSPVFHPPLVATEDGFRRRVSYLRLSLTDRCTLRCGYCMPSQGMTFHPPEDTLATPEILRLLNVFRSLGVVKVRLTGGEPLLRSDIGDILAHLAHLGVEDVSLTTNGVALAEKLPGLLRAGLRRVNISLDTFRPKVFHRLTGADALPRVLAGVRTALASPLSPVKINMVVLRQWNWDEVPDFVHWAQANPVHVRFLELMPTRNTFEGRSVVDERDFVPSEEVRARVESLVTLEPEDPIQGVARVHAIKGGLGRVGFVSPVSNHFCATCNRVRLTSTGGLKTCLHGESVVDLRGALRRGASDDELRGLIRSALFQKPEEHFIRPDHFVSPHLRMSQVGG